MAPGKFPGPPDRGPRHGPARGRHDDPVDVLGQGRAGEAVTAAAGRQDHLGAHPRAAAGAPAGAPPATATDTALHVLFGYIPTEVLTVYLAVVAALQPSVPASAQGCSVPGTLPAFVIFLIATPVIVWVVFAGKLRGAGKNLPLAPSMWPLWEMVAGTIAFAAWAFALPNNPFECCRWYKPSFAAIAVLVSSTLLGLLALLFTKPLKSS